METLARMSDARLIPMLSPKKPEQALPLLAALCSGGIFAAQFSMEVPFTPDAIRSGARLFPGFILGAGDITRPEQAKAAIQCGARYLTSPGYSPALGAICREHEVLYLPQCMTPSELLSARMDGLSAVGLFAPHLWSPDTVDALLSAFSGLSAVACKIPHTQAEALLTHPGMIAATVTGLPCDTPEELAAFCSRLAVLNH